MDYLMLRTMVQKSWILTEHQMGEMKVLHFSISTVLQNDIQMVMKKENLMRFLKERLKEPKMVNGKD
jgi:hypothetical protein